MKGWIVGALAAALVAATVAGVAEEKQEGGGGFAGMLAGKVVAKDGTKLQVEVTGIEKTWKHNKLENPQSLVGKKVRVAPSDKSPNVARYADKLSVGDADVFDVKQDGEIMLWLELTGKQREKIGLGRDKK